MLGIGIPVLILLIGLLIYVLSTKVEVKELGRIMFMIGLFWAVARSAGGMMKIGFHPFIDSLLRIT